MKKIFQSKKAMIIVISLAVIGFIAIIVNNYMTKTSFKYRNQNDVKVERNQQDAVSKAVNDNANNKNNVEFSKVLRVSGSEMYLGDKNAPVTIIEYASLSCPHCAAFYKRAFDDLNEDFIQTGKVRFIYRDFPLNQPALAGAIVAVCRSKIEDQENKANSYYNFVKALYKNQDNWAFDPNFIAKLESIAILDGMTKAQFNKCIEDTKLQEKILNARLIAAKSLNINSTPTFFINGEVLEGFIDYKTIKKAVKKALKKAQ